MNTKLSTFLGCYGAALGATGLLAVADQLHAQTFTPGDIVVSSSTYMGALNAAGTAQLMVGDALPGGGTATVDGSIANETTVWNNEAPDASFGVLAPIFLNQFTTSGAAANLAPSPYVTGNSFNVTSAAAAQGETLLTSFSSKSELALNLSANGSSITFMGYQAPVGSIDRSNASTPAVTNFTNADTATPTFREVGQVSSSGLVQTTTTNAYSGDNARAAVLASNGQYYTVGSTGSASASAPTADSVTGAQLITPGVNASPSTPGTSSLGTFSVQQTNPATGMPYQAAADNPGKDNNLRGLTINPFNNTEYVSKGSGGKGIDTVYQVGTAGSLPTGANNPITVLPGLPTTLAKNIGPSNFSTDFHPFGLFFASATTLYVADEGDAVTGGTANFGPATTTGTELYNATNNPNAGLEKWTLNTGTGQWSLAYTLQTGLNLGTQYTVNGLNPASGLDPANAGIRNITGKVNGDGTVTIFGLTSTVSQSTDPGADPNQLVSITDILANTSPAVASTESFNTLETANSGQVLRGVAFAPVPEPGTVATTLGAGLALCVVLRRRLGLR